MSRNKRKGSSSNGNDRKLPLSAKLIIVLLSKSIKTLNIFAPKLAAHYALRIFLTPIKFKRPRSEDVYLDTCVEETVFTKDFKLRVRKWGQGPNVLLVHGWGGRSTQLGAFIPSLIKQGYGVIAFDGPAHGESTGKCSDHYQFAEAVATVARAHGPLSAIIAHSFGASCTMLAMRDFDLAAEKVVLISCFDSPIWVTEDFARQLSIPLSVAANMRRIVENKYQNKWRWEDLEITDMVSRVSIPILLIHDKQDKETPYEHSYNLLKSGPSCTLFATEGLGHRRILRSDLVIQKSVEFINNMEAHNQRELTNELMT